MSDKRDELPTTVLSKDIQHLQNPKHVGQESWHLSWVYRGEDGNVRHGDNVFDVKPRLTAKNLPDLRKLIAEQMDCGVYQLSITSMTRLPR